MLKNNKKIIIISIIILLILSITISSVIIIKTSTQTVTTTPTIKIETPQKISIEKENTFTLDVTISTLGDSLYPAASMSISFDSSKLEFLGLEEGNVLIYKKTEEGVLKEDLPNWMYDINTSNKLGLINIIYYDLTGGDNSFSNDLLSKDNNIIFKLKFRLRGSAKIKDVYNLIIEDAIFAANEETQSLSSLNETLKVVNSKIIIGE